MRYDKESNILIISLGEFVSTARRGICSHLPKNDDEPSLLSSGKKSKKPTVEITHDFTIGNYSFHLVGSADAIDGDRIEITVPTDSSPTRPRRELVTEARGEGYTLAYMHAKSSSYKSVEIKYIYKNLDTGEENEVFERVSFKKAESFFDKCKISVSVYALPEIERVTARLPSMKDVKFPYGKPRPGQAELVRSVYRNISRGTRLFAAAPTGTGKTVSVLFPAVRALGGEKCDKVFYFTPKTTTADAARECLIDLCEAGADLRAVIISSKERACKNRLVCRTPGGRCENSRYNKLCDATLALYKKRLPVATLSDIGEVAKEYKVCPHELSFSYAELCDVVICDLNYLFDSAVYIRRFFDRGGNYAFLIDEAHNLPDRARDMYSAELSERAIIAPLLAEVIGEHSKLRREAELGAKEFYDLLMPYVKEELICDDEGILRGAVHLSEIPTPLYDIIDRLISTAENEIFLASSATDKERDERVAIIKDYYYNLKKFRTAMGDFDSSYEFFIFSDDNEIRAKCFCIDPGRQISRRLDKGGSAVFFSGTLTPMYYYRSVLGGDSGSDTLEADSPFDPSQLSVSIMDKISTRLSEREDTLTAVSRVIAATVSAKRGHYMIFSPSFAYSEALSRFFRQKYPKIRVITQKKDMTAKEKAEFLDEFKNCDEDSYLIGFCVMGGIYAEGVDLSGDSLIGAVIVGIGIPSLSYEREAISAFYNEKYDEGKQFAYIYPGMNRVLQAAGRVIRSESDKGVIVLIDDRFDDPIYKNVIPKLWDGMKFISDAKELRTELDEFWREDKEER